jgi:hypothetical protein
LEYSRRDQGYLFLVRRGNRRHRALFDLALFAFLLLSFVACVLHFRRVWFSLQKLQSFHTKRKKHISNKMDSEEEKKEDKGEHINLKVKDQVRFCRRCVCRRRCSRF